MTDLALLQELADLHQWEAHDMNDLTQPRTAARGPALAPITRAAYDAVKEAYSAAFKRAQGLNQDYHKLLLENRRLRKEVGALRGRDGAPVVHPTRGMPRADMLVRLETPQGATFLHLKSRGVYTVFGHCVLEATGRLAVLYRPETDGPGGTIWARDAEEFLDGRFVRVPRTFHERV